MLKWRVCHIFLVSIAMWGGLIGAGYGLWRLM